MNESWICRSYSDGDEYQILDLNRRVFGEELSLDYWKWRFRENPFGGAIIKLMFDGNRLVSHHTATPMNVWIGNTSVRAGHTHTVMTDPDYERRGLSTYLGEEVRKEARARGFKFVYAFPNRNSYPVFTKRLGWRGLGQMSILCRDLDSGSTTPATDAIYQIHRVERFDEDVNLLWEEVKHNYKAIIPRTREYLNWRFVQNPAERYIKYVLKNSRCGVAGYIVLKVYAARDEVWGHIVDILTIDNKDIVKRLLNPAYGYFIENGIKKLSCWMQDNYFCADVLKEEGFIRKELDPYPYFAVKVFDEAANDVEQAANWFLTMSDSDVF